MPRWDLDAEAFVEQAQRARQMAEPPGAGERPFRSGEGRVYLALFDRAGGTTWQDPFDRALVQVAWRRVAGTFR